MIPKQQRLFVQWIILILTLLLLAACNPNSDIIPDQEQQAPPAAQPGSQEAASLDMQEVEEPPTAVLGSGQVYTVNPNGSDGDDGSQYAPWRSIQHAVDNVAPGDTILLQSGTYSGARIERSGTADSWIALAAAPGAAVIINSPGPNNRHDSNLEFETWEGEETVSYWLIDGMEVTNAPNWGIDVRGSEGNHSHHFIIRNNRVHSNGLEGETSGIFTAFVDDVIVEGNQSYSNGEHGIYLSNSGDRYVVRGNLLHHNNNCGLHINGDLESGEDGIISNGLIENNHIYENGRGGCSGINMDGVTDTIIRSNLLTQNHAGGISLFQENGTVCSQNIQLLNNTILQAEDSRWAINLSNDDCVNNKIFNNIILTSHEWRGSILIPSSSISGFESDHNVIMDRFSSDDDNSVISLSEWQALGYDLNSVIATPTDLFANSNDFHLLPQSPAIDAGLTLPGVKFDLDGTPRPQGAAYDIGAFETIAVTPEQTQSPGVPAAFQTSESGGTITYTFDDRVYRHAAQEGATPEDISQALDQLSSGTGDTLLNISSDGDWLVLETERFDPECTGWACLALISADLSSGDVIRGGDQVIHPEGISAVASGGEMVVYSAGDGPHEIDLWAVSRAEDTWSGPLLLTAGSPYDFNNQPALSDDGRTVLFDCGSEPYAGEGAALCEVETAGDGFKVLLTPADSPTGFPTVGSLHHPDYAPDGSIIFEGDWGSEQIWRLPSGASKPVLVTDKFGNDNSPCVLPDGRIVSLWLERPDGSGIHEVKVMSSDGSSFIILLPDVDVLDAGIGCAP